GWRFHRIWSTDWFLRKDDEVKRTMAAFQEAVKFADGMDADPAAANASSNGRSKMHANGSATLNAGVQSAAVQPRRPRPAIPLKPSIAQYSPRELAELIHWIASDGKLRTDEEIVSEMVSVLGFARRGVRIESAIKNAISFARTTSSVRGLL
ncbi:MAG TPA: hypothetical protein VFO46_06805, partial [Candidatus Sulfotelmatobacter sp.]|nr:hypothetical protein [Candidatus Sulfotelmatobacter sp.]